MVLTDIEPRPNEFFSELTNEARGVLNTMIYKPQDIENLPPKFELMGLIDLLVLLKNRPGQYEHIFYEIPQVRELINKGQQADPPTTPNKTVRRFITRRALNVIESFI